jgi:hypothetical protein
MASERDDGFGTNAVRLLINLAALGVSAGIVALIVATIIVEID